METSSAKSFPTIMNSNEQTVVSFDYIKREGKSWPWQSITHAKCRFSIQQVFFARQRYNRQQNQNQSEHKISFGMERKNALFS